MQPIPTALARHINSEVTTLATCWKLTRKDGSVMGFTDHDQDIQVESTCYHASSGFTPSAIHTSVDFTPDTMAVQGILSHEGLREEDIMAGAYDGAEIEIFMVNYQQVDMGRIWLKKGWMGEITVQGKRFIASLYGLTDRFSHTIGALYSPLCRAQLGDTHCKVVMGRFSWDGVVAGTSGPNHISDPLRNEQDGFFDGGVVTFLSGRNQGHTLEIARSQQGYITFSLPFPYPIAIGDSYKIQLGCDKTFTTCRQRFANAINFRGEPHVPGSDQVLKTAGTFR